MPCFIHTPLAVLIVKHCEYIGSMTWSFVQNKVSNYMPYLRFTLQKLFQSTFIQSRIPINVITSWFCQHLAHDEICGSRDTISHPRLIHRVHSPGFRSEYQHPLTYVHKNVKYHWWVVKRKSAFEHAQNVRIHLRMRKISSGHLLSIETFYSTQYSQNPMTGTSLGPWKFVRDMGSSSQWGLIMTPGQEANGDNLGKSFPSSIQ